MVQFHVSPEMTRLDIKQYLEKIYNLPVLSVETFILKGRTHYRAGTDEQVKDLYKDDDTKIATVIFPKDFQFEFPEVTKVKDDKSQEEQYKEDMEQQKRSYRKTLGKHSLVRRRGVSNFFGL